jgi:hypothetical protein
MEMERKRTSATRATCVVALVLTALFLAGSLQAQETRGRITGRVTDTTKAPVPGASVTVKDASRGTSAASTTNGEGLFQVNYLLPGTYQVTVEVAGFKKHVQDKVQVQISQTRDLPVVLEVGGLTEAVSVTAEGAALNSSDASMGFTVDAKRLEELPLIHGDPYKIMGLATGLAHSGDQRLDRPYEPTHIVGYAYDGTRSNRSDLLIDGAPSTSTANQNEVIASYVPPSDLVQEFKVQTATFDAQFGNTEGGVTSISIKSGTNKLHGTVYYFAEPKSLAANDYFGNSRGQARPDTSSNRPGFTLTGPVRIPGLYDGRDKTFFTVGYERIKDVRPRFDAGADSWVPTEALRNGDFSAYAGNITIYDPLTRVPSGSQFVGQPFPGNVIPANRISPVSKAILDYYSLPKGSGLNGNIYDSTLPETADYSSFTGRLDQKISTNNKMFARYSWYNRDSIYNEYLGTPVSSGTWFQFQSYQAVIDDVHVINPTTVLNIRYGYNRFERNSGQEEEARNFDLTTLGYPAEYNTLIPEANRYFPRLDFDGTTMIDVAYANDFRPTTSHTAVATLNKVMAAHSLKGGMEMRIYREDSLSTANAQAGQYAFTNAYTRQTSASGTDYQGLQNYASFLLGMPATTSILRASDYSEYSKTWGFFVQDDWRVNDKLTLNLGLRYEVETALTERNDKSVSGFDYDYVQPIEPQVQARYAALNDPVLKSLVPQLSVKGGVLFAGVDGQSSRLYETPKDSFLPRFGFAYQLNSKTIIRGGAGLFAGFLGQRRGDVFPNGWAQTTTVGTVNNAFGAPVPRNWDTALLTTPILEPVGNANGQQQGLGQAIDFFNQDPGVSKQLRYQIGFQRELPGGFVVEAAYVGNYGYDIEIVRNINALPNQYLNTDNSRTAAMDANNSFLTGSVANPFAGLLPGTSFNNPTIARNQLMRAYPQFGDIRTTNNDGKSWYSSVQVGLQKRFSHGYTLGLSYTYSNWETATEYLNPADAEPTRMISDLDVPHRLSVSGILELPFGKGRRFLSDADGFLNALVGGWQIQGVYTFQSGFPVPFGSYNANTGVTSGDLFYNGGDIGIDDRTTDRWFNTDAFASILNGTATNATPVNHLRTLPYRFDDVRRDSINNVDLSLIKDIQLKGDVKVQLRAEFINAFNEAYFPQPVSGQTSTTFGQVTASNQANYARRAQVGVKVVF